MIIESRYPYEEYKTYLIINKENRRHVCLYKKNIRTTMSYARWLISTDIKRVLDKSEHVDHINNDKTDDRIENLQILSAKDNTIKYQKTTRGRKYATLKCPMCNSLFDREYNKTFKQNGSKFNCCSKNCLHRFLKTHHTTEQLLKIRDEQIISVFYKNHVD
jgi:hypothetical protein